MTGLCFAGQAKNFSFLDHCRWTSQYEGVDVLQGDQSHYTHQPDDGGNLVALWKYIRSGLFENQHTKMVLGTIGVSFAWIWINGMRNQQSIFYAFHTCKSAPAAILCVTLAGHHPGHPQGRDPPPKLLAIWSTFSGGRVDPETLRGSSGSYTEHP